MTINRLKIVNEVERESIFIHNVIAPWGFSGDVCIKTRNNHGNYYRSTYDIWYHPQL